MSHPSTKEGPVDAVITWVNGDAQRALRTAYMAQAAHPLHANTTNPHRWADNDEIYFCLQSIENHAPWVRTIWIVTNGVTPDLARLSPALRRKIAFADHHSIFGPYKEALPTFNSLAIESMMWRINGLADRFLYFNDDVFLTAPLALADVFDGPRPILRGAWGDQTALVANPAARDDPAKFNHFMQINAATLAGFTAAHHFVAAHVVHPMRRDTMAALFARHKTAFLNNIGHRFRDLSQFLPQGLHNHALIASDDAVIRDTADHFHITSGMGSDAPPDHMRRLLGEAKQARVKFVCVNDLPQLETLIPEVRAWVTDVIGGFPA